MQDYECGANTSYCVPVYVPAFAGAHCAYSWRHGQAEMTWVAVYQWWLTRTFTRDQGQGWGQIVEAEVEAEDKPSGPRPKLWARGQTEDNFLSPKITYHIIT